MKRITQIDICNYRAFYNENGNRDKYRIDLPNGENLLIYGENGSGKSSFFKALNEIFLSAKSGEMTIRDNIFSLTDPDLPEAEVKITISEKTLEGTSWFHLPELVFNNSAPTTYGNPILNDSSASFLTYRDILRTYFLDIDNHDENPNLFKLIFNELLRNVTDSSTNETIIDVLATIEEKVNTIEGGIKDTMALPDENDSSKTQLETKGLNVIRDEIIGQINTDIEEFNISVTSTLDNALIYVNRYLDESFKSNIEVSIENRDRYLSLKHEGENFTLTKDLRLDINYYRVGQGIESYQVFLNEARLSALALCIYLAAVKLDQTSDENLKMIFLDDIFIGLDTSNRIPLLEILNKDFNEFQLFITTYDRQWYELAKSYLNNWKSIEMYVGKNDILQIEFPVIIDADLEYIEKAKRLIDSFDYPSAGNTIRKAFERQIEKLIPRCYLITENDLDGYFNQLIKYYKNCNCEDLIDKKLKNDLYVFKDIILNPTSHNDLRSPIYKGEVERAYKILKSVYDIPILKRVPILNVGDTLYYNNSANNYKAQYILTETVYSITYSENNSTVTIPEHKLVYWEYKNIAFSNLDGKKYDKNSIDSLKNIRIKLTDRPKRIQHFLSLPDLPNWLTEFKNSKGQSIGDLQFLNGPET
jgi:recombinational DNA repair ATPase RecF